MRRKVWIWFLGIAIAAGVVSFVWSRASRNDLVVRLVDWDTGKPATNAAVRVWELLRVPVIHRLAFLPTKVCWHLEERRLLSKDGELRVRRFAWFDEKLWLWFEAEGFQTEMFDCRGNVLWPGSGSRIGASQGRTVISAEEPVVIRLKRLASR